MGQSQTNNSGSLSAQLLWQTIPDFLFLLDSGGIVLDANPKTLAALNCSPDELFHHPLARFFVDQPPLAAKIAAVWTSRDEKFETIMEMAGGRTIPVEVRLLPVEATVNEAESPLLLGIVREISEKKIGTDWTRHHRFEAAALATKKISHSYNNIITGIVGSISSATAGDSPELRKRLAKYTEKSISTCQGLNLRLSAFCNNRPMGMVPFPLDNLITKALSEVEFPPEIQVDLNLPSNLPEIIGEPNRLIESFTLILLNAIEAMPTGGMIFIRARKVGGSENKRLSQRIAKYIMIEIQDTGDGIPEKISNKIFDPYFTTKEHHQGLGLAICYAVLQQHCGQLEVASTMGKGTTVTLSLPVAQPDMTKKKEVQPPGGKGRILFMDDEEPVRKVGLAMLSNLGYRVDCASDGYEALRLYKEAKETGTPYDLVIMDLTVPDGFGGESVIQELRNFDPQVKAIISSGFSSNPIMADYQHHGFSGVLKKPYGISQLKGLVAELLTPPEDKK